MTRYLLPLLALLHFGIATAADSDAGKLLRDEFHKQADWHVMGALLPESRVSTSTLMACTDHQLINIEKGLGWAEFAAKYKIETRADVRAQRPKIRKFFRLQCPINGEKS